MLNNNTRYPHSQSKNKESEGGNQPSRGVEGRRHKTQRTRYTEVELLDTRHKKRRNRRTRH